MDRAALGPGGVTGVHADSTETPFLPWCCPVANSSGLTQGCVVVG